MLEPQSSKLAPASARDELLEDEEEEEEEVAAAKRANHKHHRPARTEHNARGRKRAHELPPAQSSEPLDELLHSDIEVEEEEEEEEEAIKEKAAKQHTASGAKRRRQSV